MRIKKAIALTSGYRFEVGALLTIRHYSYGLTPSGFVKADELIIRAEDDEGRVVHVWRDEIEAIELPNAAE